MHKILKSYLKRLTNLTVSNRSLLLLKLSEEQDLDISSLDFINGKPAFAIIEQILAGKSSIVICKESDSRSAVVNEVSKKLRKIARREKFIFEERGSKDLYIGWPFVKGKLSDGIAVRCPLLFFPVTVAVEDGQWNLKLREEVPVGFNKSFLLAYSHYNHIPISDDLIDTSFEDFNTDSQVFRTELYSLLKESPLEINFNQDLFINKIIPFDHFRKQDFEEKYGTGELKLFSEAVLGIFPQTGSNLVSDYDYLIDNNLIPDLEDFFYRRSGNIEQSVLAGRSVVVKEEHTITPFPLDASQENAISTIKKGKSLVVQGPPGTGKSQLICNLIADYIARGKNVLLVCQKRAALDVVYHRLKQKGLNEFIGLVHDVKNDRNQLYKQIHSQIEKLDEYKFKNNSLDAISLERNFVQACRRIEQLTEKLDEFKKALFDDKEFGLAIKELYLTTDVSLPPIDFKHEYRYFKIEELAHFKRVLESILPYAIKFEKQDYLWNDRVSFADFGITDKKTILKLLDHIPFFQSNITEEIRVLLGATLDIEDHEWILAREEQIRQLLLLLEDSNVYSYFQFILSKNTNQDWLMIHEKKVYECFRGSGVEQTLQKEELGHFHNVLENATQARGNVFKWIRWSLFSKEKPFLKKVIAANNLKWNKTGIGEITKRVDNRMNLEHNLTLFKECGWLQNIPSGKNIDSFSNWFHEQHAALAAKSLLKELGAFKEYLNINELSYEALKDKLENLIAILSPIPSEKKQWLRYFTPRQLSKISCGFDYAIDLGNLLKEDFEHLVAYDSVKDKLVSYERSVLEKLIRISDKFNVLELLRLFENGIKLEWIESIEMKYPELRFVSSLKMEQMEKELQDLVIKKEGLSADILLMKVREKTYSQLEYNRLENLVTYRDLKHQVSKKKKIWPIRKVLANYYSEVFKLVPCWLASPDSVSSLFPMEADFDLVIFDEASQCYTENGIPALYRGRQVVIAGDSKQLAPTDLYTIRFEEDNDIAELEIDSLLDLGKQYLSQVYLQGHYRSKSLELIEFSNTHFYNRQLKMLPDYEELNKNEPALSYIKVNGIWRNNVNEEEALTIVRLTKALIETYKSKSIGIVTFNYKQQLLIHDLLEEEIGYWNTEQYFVKNIENVQGDESDIIIFSIGYAPNDAGKLIMNFGTLGQENGENRLNVAVTRAREKVVVVTSIHPEQLDVANVKNEGPKLLRKYLEYVRDVSSKKFVANPITSQQRSDWYLKNQISKLDNSLHTTADLPFADLAIKKNSKYTGLILTDDDTYYQSLSSKEAHAYMPISLHRKNWKFKKIYSRLFWEDKQKVKDSLIKAFGTNA